MSSRDLIRKPGGFLPMGMSVAALGLVLPQLVTVAVTRQADEGTTARLFHLLLAAQLPIVAYFAVR